MPVPVKEEKIGVFPNEKGELTQCQSKRIYSIDAKGRGLNAGPGGLGVQTGLYAIPAAGRVVGRRINEQGHRDDYNEAIPHFQYFEVNEDPQKTNCLTTVQKDNMIAVPVRVGAIPNRDGELGTSQSRRIYSTEGKSVSLQARPNGGGADGAATGLYAVPAGMAWRGRENGSAFEMRDDQKSNTVGRYRPPKPPGDRRSGRKANAGLRGSRRPYYHQRQGIPH